MLMEHQVKFCGARNISGASQKNSKAALSQTTEVAGDFIKKCKKNPKKQPNKKKHLHIFYTAYSKSQEALRSRTDLKRLYLNPFLTWDLHCSCWVKAVSAQPVWTYPFKGKFGSVDNNTLVKKKKPYLSSWRRSCRTCRRTAGRRCVSGCVSSACWASCSGCRTPHRCISPDRDLERKRNLRWICTWKTARTKDCIVMCFSFFLSFFLSFFTEESHFCSVYIWNSIDTIHHIWLIPKRTD